MAYIINNYYMAYIINNYYNNYLKNSMQYQLHYYPRDYYQIQY